MRVALQSEKSPSSTPLLALFVLLFVACSVVVAGRAPIRAGDDVPSWLRQAASTPHPPYENRVPAVVLHSEQSVKVDEDGRVTTTERRALKVLSGEGQETGFCAGILPDRHRQSARYQSLARFVHPNR